MSTLPTKTPTHAPMTQCAIESGELVCGCIPLPQLAERVGQTPFYAYDRALLRERVTTLRAALLALLLVVALSRCCFGLARVHPLAPALVGAVAAVLAVGLIDSLLDAPRIALLFYGLLLVMLPLRWPTTSRGP